jgi:hypothetical protein
MGKRKRLAACTYCGKHAELTNDHVPPKCLFPPAEREHLVTVPACQKCNSGFSKDDEYFRLMLSVRIDLPENDATAYIQDSTKRSLTRVEAAHFRKMLKSSVTRVPIHTDAGVYVGHAPAVQVDGNRLKRTCERTVKGLYAKFLKHPVPSSYAVQAVLFDFQRDYSGIDSPEVQEMLRALGRAKNHHKFGSVLEVWYAIADDDPDSSLWCIRMHNVFTYLGFTTPVAT